MKAGFSVVDLQMVCGSWNAPSPLFGRIRGLDPAAIPSAGCLLVSAETFALALLFQPGPCWRRGICDGDLSSDGFSAYQKLESPADLHAMQSWGSVPAAEPRNSSKVT